MSSARFVSRRGLLEAHGFSDGLREVLQCVAPAERLPEPVNAYPERKVSLQQASLEYAVEVLADRSTELHEGLELGPSSPTQPSFHRISGILVDASESVEQALLDQVGAPKWLGGSESVDDLPVLL